MKNITAAQAETLQELSTSGLVRYTWANDLGVASFARGDFGSMGSAPIASIQTFLQNSGQPFGPPDIREAARFIRMREDSLGWRHFEYQQTYALADAPDNEPGSAPPGTQRRRLDVNGAFLSFHLDAQQRLVEIQSSFWRDVFVLHQNPMNEESLRLLLRGALARAPGTARLVALRGRASFDRVIMLGRQSLVVFPHRGGFRLAWRIRAAVPAPRDPGGGTLLLPGLIFVDAVTGEQLYEGVTASEAETPDAGTGLSNLPFDAPPTSRPLQIVRVDAGDTYRLRDTTHSRDIITYDWAGADPDYFETGNLLSNGSVPVSSDTDGDKNWNDVAADDSQPALTASQQTEVDAHFNTEKVYEWYDAIAGGAGREGFDDDNYGGQVPGNMPIHLLAHVGINNAQFYMTPNDDSEEVSYLSFSDTISDIGHRAWAASPFVVCHEYQHGITAHSVGGASPGYSSGVDDWASALTEGLSDVFSGMYSRLWHFGTELSPEGLILRNIAFPRDPAAASIYQGKDHWADRNTDDTDVGLAYARGLILAHCAYLIAQGGVHQRLGRTPELIPVHPLESEASGGLEVSEAARVWYRMMATRFAAVSPYDNETTFEKIRTECEASAMDLYGEGSPAHRGVVQAFYAVGLHPVGETYGADVTALRWGHSWRFSRPYVGIPSPDWASPDLFINNGGTSDWNAIINPDFGDIHFENAVYCRVRNIGQLTANNVVVEFEYAKYGTAPVEWTPLRDAALAIQQLTIDALPAGAENFSMDDQNNPPETARVLWSVPPLQLGDEVDHYCIRATMTSDNDVNPHNGVIQSNVAYSTFMGMMRISRAFHIGNPTDRPLRPQLRLTTTLPAGWRARIREDLTGLILPPQTEHVVHVDVERPAGSSPDDDTRCLAPFEGEVRGDLGGSVCGQVSGTFTRVHGSATALTGTIALRMKGGGLLAGRFDGRLDCACGELSGRVTGLFQCGEETRRTCAGLRACLRPFRRVEIEQYDGERALGGVTLQFQIPMPEKCHWPFAPTDTRYRPRSCDNRSAHDKATCCGPGDGLASTGKVLKLCFDCFGDFEGFILDLCGSRLTCRSREPGIEAIATRAFEARWRIRVELDEADGAVRKIAVLQ
jgi:Zn-dependent metalloprotease